MLEKPRLEPISLDQRGSGRPERPTTDPLSKNTLLQGKQAIYRLTYFLSASPLTCRPPGPPDLVQVDLIQVDLVQVDLIQMDLIQVEPLAHDSSDCLT